MSHRPLAIVSGLTIGDYLLWNWSLNANHDVLALVSGLTLPPLTIAFLWLVALTTAPDRARLAGPGLRGRGQASPPPAAAVRPTATAALRTGELLAQDRRLRRSPFVERPHPLVRQFRARRASARSSRGWSC